MKCCCECGHKLIHKELEHEGMVPYCESCQTYRFPYFNSAVSMVVLNPFRDKILMIQQYGRKNNILVAGYINKGECAEEALVREVKEEIGRDVLTFKYMKSEYFEKSESLIFNYAIVVDSESLADVSTWEVDSAKWFRFDDAKKEVKKDSLAERFLLNFFSVFEQEPF